MIEPSSAILLITPLQMAKLNKPLRTHGAPPLSVVIL
jgi:hypothetical protein